MGFEPAEARVQRPRIREARPPEQPHDVVHRLRRGPGIAGGPAVADQEPDVAHDAVPDLAEAGQVDEQPFLEQERQRIVDIGRFSEAPQLLNQPRHLRCGLEEFGRRPKRLVTSALKAMFLAMSSSVVCITDRYLPWPLTYCSDSFGWCIFSLAMMLVAEAVHTKGFGLLLGLAT